MKILFTGSSSFTGYWFIRALVEAGHEVIATFTAPGPESYPEAEVRGHRVRRVQKLAKCEFDTRFGDERMLNLVSELAPLDLLCHHGAEVGDYKSPDFDVPAAVARNTHNLRPVLAAAQAAGCKRVLLTGSVFEGGEGAGSDGLPHFSAYGLSKALTAEVFRYACETAGVALGKFVIPNPFGPCEEPRFCTYLVRNWLAGKTPGVNTPDYVRDNIHVSLLGAAYARFAADLPDTPGFTRISPSGYIESQGAFALRFAREMADRLGCPCPVDLALQTDFPEPRIRINTDPVVAADFAWDEASAWDELARDYLDRLGEPS